jgi:hypothetical protein
LKYSSFPLEPFVERICAAHDFGTSSGYRIGYRLGPSGETITSITVSAETIEKTLKLCESVALGVTPDGQVRAETTFLEAPESRLREAFPIDILVRNTLNSENLRMEEATVSDLKTLLQRLEQSVGLVKDAIDQMAGASEGSS